MSPELLAHLTPEERAVWDACAAATAPPWHLSADRQTLTQTNHVTRDVWTIPHVLEDMDFIAAARPALPVALRTVAILRAELVEAQATLDNECGEGTPPSAGWAWDTVHGCWKLLDTRGIAQLAAVERWAATADERPYWTVATKSSKWLGGTQRYPTARAAMKAADAGATPPVPG